MRLVSYNIMNGGEGRADPLAEVLLAQRADIVVLLEADNSSVLDRIALRLRMDCFHARGPGHGVALLSRWPIVETIDQAGLRSGTSDPALEGTVCDPSGGAWTVATGAVRLTRPHLLAGNFDAMAVSELMRAGYIDTLAAIDERAGRTRMTFPTKYPSERVDYILVHGIDRSRIGAAWVEQDRLAKYASDHFPVGVDIE